MVFLDLLKTMVEQSAAVVESIQRSLVAYASDDRAEAQSTGPYKPRGAQDDEPLVIMVCDGQIAKAFETFKPSRA